MAKYRNSDIFGSTELDLSDGPMWKITPQNEAAATERVRLERKVIDAARRLYAVADLEDAATNKSQDNDLLEAVKHLYQSVEELETFKAPQEKKG